jgi:acyl carrier protein
MDTKTEEIYNKVKKIIAEVLNIEEEKITPESKIVVDLGAESLDIITLLMEFEDAFNGKIPDEDAEKLVTVNDAVEYIKALTNKG